MILEGHFYVKPRELGHVSVSEGLLRSKDRAHLKDSRHVCHQGHLFVQLGTLCQVGIALKIVYAEHIRTSLRCATDELWSVDLLEIVLQQKLPEEHAHPRLETKDGLVRHRSQVDDAVVQADVLTHCGQRWIFLQLCLTSGCVCQAQWQRLRPANAEDLLNGEFHVLHRARHDGVLWTSHLAKDIHHRLVRQHAGEAGDVLSESDGLHRGHILT
mmetsp:Transcript_19911/g.33306  ORF Transcript_19911/g.33306 Transcript_19911/m.33306 type:complete len:214 (+) Transcript_19911:374-1015(+)